MSHDPPVPPSGTRPWTRYFAHSSIDQHGDEFAYLVSFDGENRIDEVDGTVQVYLADDVDAHRAEVLTLVETIQAERRKLAATELEAAALIPEDAHVHMMLKANAETNLACADALDRLKELL